MTGSTPSSRDEDHILPEPEGAADTSYSTVRWPDLRWRGDLTKRHLTAGTLLSLIAANNGGYEALGVTISSLELELRRVAHKYRGRDSSDIGYGKTINGDKLYSESSAIRGMLHGLVFLTGAVEYLSDRDTGDEAFDPDDLTAVRLTGTGLDILDEISARCAGDRRFEHLDMSDPILEFDCTSGDSGTTMVETLGVHESTLPMKRDVSLQPFYRQWLWIVLNNPITYSVLKSGIDPTHPLLFSEGSVEAPEHIVAAFTESQKPFLGTGDDPRLPASFWAARVQTEFIRPFAREVLSGGPDLMWAGKPIKPEFVHSDVEVFVAAGRAGFTVETEMIRRSSLAWEMFEADEFTLTQYSATRMAMDSVAVDSSIITVTHIPEAPEDDDLEGAELTTDKRGVIGLPTVEKLIMKRSSDALMDSALGRSVANPGDALRGKLMRVRCEYVLNAKHKDKRRSCDRWAIGGSTRCEIHGGEYLDEEETKSLLRANQSKLWAMSSKAIDVVGELMMHSTNDSVRLAASRLIMEKSGFAQQIEINVTDTSDIMENPGEVVRDRLRRLGKTAASMHAELESAVDAEVVDAEVQDVQDDDDFVPPPYVPGETPQF